MEKTTHSAALGSEEDIQGQPRLVPVLPLKCARVWSLPLQMTNLKCTRVRIPPMQMINPSRVPSKSARSRLYIYPLQSPCSHCNRHVPNHNGINGALSHVGTSAHFKSTLNPNPKILTPNSYTLVLSVRVSVVFPLETRPSALGQVE